MRELEDQCTKLKEAVQNLPDMEVESMDSLMDMNAQGTIAFVRFTLIYIFVYTTLFETDKIGPMKTISQATKEKTEEDEENNGRVLVIEES